MTSNRLRPVFFGMAGVVDLAADTAILRKALGNLAQCFEQTRETVRVTWHGHGIEVVTLQHFENALTVPGEYEHDMPQIGPCQGVLKGCFLTGYKNPTHSLQGLMDMSRDAVSGYVDQGLSTLTQLNGSWTAVVVNSDTQSVVLARDRIGVDTLYATQHGSRVVFASDLRVLRGAGFVEGYDKQAILEFLHFLYVPSPRSIYKDATSVLPGHALIINRAMSQQKRYAPPRFIEGTPLCGGEEVSRAVKAHLPTFEQHLLSAAEACLPERGRVGLLLSSGKDSAALALALKEIAPDRVVALTVGSTDPRYDESDYATRMCGFLGIPHKVYTPEPDALVPGFLDLVACEDQPMADPASLPLLLALRHWPPDVSVIWDGTGNDYYFGSVRKADNWRYGRRLQFNRYIPRFAWPWFLRLMELGPERFASTARDWQTPIEEAFVSWRGWTKEELALLVREHVDWPDTYLAHVVRAHADKGWIAMQTEVFGAIWTPNAAFRKTAYAAQASGLAVRLPFIDNRLADYANGLPRELKYQGHVNKVILRAYLDSKLPKELVHRPKGSFVFDQSSLLQRMDAVLAGRFCASSIHQTFQDWSDTYASQVAQVYRRSPVEYVDRIYALTLLSMWVKQSEGELKGEHLCAF